jgi:hypothetical protein
MANEIIFLTTQTSYETNREMKRTKQFITGTRNHYQLLRDIDFSFMLNPDETIRIQVRKLNPGCNFKSILGCTTFKQCNSFSTVLLDDTFEFNNSKQDIKMSNSTLTLEIPFSNMGKDSMYSHPYVILQ